jgi:hypothetical protein
LSKKREVVKAKILSRAKSSVRVFRMGESPNKKMQKRMALLTADLSNIVYVKDIWLYEYISSITW